MSEFDPAKAAEQIRQMIIDEDPHLLAENKYLKAENALLLEAIVLACRLIGQGAVPQAHSLLLKINQAIEGEL